MVRVIGVEPIRFSSEDFESSASTNFAILAKSAILLVKMKPSIAF